MRLGNRLTALAAATVTVLATAAAPASAATGPWSASHQTATAAGTSRVEPGGVFYYTKIVEGQLTNTSADCYSVWYRVIYDLAPGFPRKHVTQCGAGSAPVNLRVGGLTYTSTLLLRVCKGSQDTSDCGTEIRP